MSELVTLAPQETRWREFAQERATSPLQLPGWLDGLTAAYGLRAQVAALMDARGTIRAALPMIRSKAPWRRRWTALPFTDTLEPLAFEKADRDELMRAIASDERLRAVLVRARVDQPGWSTRQVGTRHEIDLSVGAQRVLAGASAHHRRCVSKARRSRAGLTAGPVRSRAEFMGPCLALTAVCRRRLGMPTQPRSYWSNLWDLHERDQALTVAAHLAGRPVASVIFVLGNGHSVLKHSANDAAYRQLCPSHLVVATALELLAEHGIKSMDFGISSLQNEGLRTYKARWGGVEHTAYFSATNAALLPDEIEPGRMVKAAVQQAPVVFGRAVGSIAYAYTA